MCAFSDDLSTFKSHGTQVLGISCDNISSHEQFSSKYKLSQPMLSDPEGKIGKLYGCVVEGKATANRKLFVIDKQGVIRHIHEGMPTNNALLDLVKSL